jgi:hypothetical protein
VHLPARQPARPHNELGDSKVGGRTATGYVRFCGLSLVDPDLSQIDSSEIARQDQSYELSERRATAVVSQVTRLVKRSNRIGGCGLDAQYCG